jgi:antitoxin ParD1/3/4
MPTSYTPDHSCAGLRPLEDRERRLKALDIGIERGMDDVQAGRVRDAEAVLDRLDAKYRVAHRKHFR